MVTIQGPWKKNHLEEHRVMFDNLISLLSDIEHAYPISGSNLPIQRDENGQLLETVIPRDSSGNPAWNEISVEYLIKWFMLNSTKVMHRHEENNGAAPNRTN